MTELRYSPAGISLLEPLLQGLQGSSAVSVFLEAMALPAMILVNRNKRGAPRFLYTNAALCDLSGFASGELVGESTRLFQGEDTDHDAALQFREDLEREGQGFTTLTAYRKDGSPYEVFMLGARLDGVSIDRPDASIFASFMFHLGDATTAMPRPPMEPRWSATN